MIAASARTASAKVVAGVAVMVAGTSIAKPVYNEEAPSSSTKLPIYPLPDAKVEVVPVQTELERQIGSARRAVSSVTAETRGSVRSLVDRWISLERSVEGEVKSLIPDTEPLTPGLLYVGVATLAGSIFTRYRAFPIRMLTPPLAAIIAVNTTNPQLAANLGAYYTQTERKYLPALTEQRQKWQHQAKELLNNTKDGLEKVKENTESSVRKGLESVESQTGLRVKDVVAAKDDAKTAIKDQMKAV
ncbi:predicted dehydrogenase [Moesziomyces antarcticus T-34]|uniref:MICOS complex subunit n=1 Tax=Pseudozyma antarctica (strain T-34) TaxID=1151754 RepID=M9MAC6_PSEA3|nr:predicted dehydrogenase [Moesziomyces antarcticus T-34]